MANKEKNSAIYAVEFTVKIILWKEDSRKEMDIKRRVLICSRYSNLRI